MSVRLLAVTFDAPDAPRLAAFWADLLGREPALENGSVLLLGDDTQVWLRFVNAAGARSGPNRLHLHLTSASAADQQQTVETALGLGAHHLDVGQRPDEGHVVLADPAGNEFCVIEPDNRYLDGCGRLGEVGCDGTREVGRFWRDALDWPLVWDQDDETAVQSPRGGTKISWGGPPVPRKHGRNRQRFHLVAADPRAEVARLVALGASEVGRDDELEVIELADPDGNEFTLSVG